MDIAFKMSCQLAHLIPFKVLLSANACADKHFDSILNSVGGVVFTGTPHQGVNRVSSAAFLSNFLRAVNVAVQIDLMRSLN